LGGYLLKFIWVGQIKHDRKARNPINKSRWNSQKARIFSGKASVSVFARLPVPVFSEPVIITGAYDLMLSTKDTYTHIRGECKMNCVKAQFLPPAGGRNWKVFKSPAAPGL
jgi:hypothetical protein